MSDKEISLREQVEAAYEAVEKTEVEDNQVSHEKNEDIEQEPPQKAQEDVEDKPSNAPENEADAPTHWSPEDRESFNELDEKSKKLYLKRYKEMEAGYTKKSQTFAEEKKIAENFKKVIANHGEYLKKIGVDPFLATDKLLETEKLLRVGTPAQKHEALQKICRDYGINFNVPQQYSQEQQPQQQYDPQTLALMQKLQALEQRQQFIEDERVQRETNSLMGHIDSFQKSVDEKGEAKYPHFETLRMDMSELLKNRMAKDLEDAYKKASRLNEDLHQEYLNRQDNSRIKEAETVKKTVASKKAGFNVKGSGGSSIAESPELKSTRQIIEEAYDSQVKRQRI